MKTRKISLIFVSVFFILDISNVFAQNLPKDYDPSKLSVSEKQAHFESLFNQYAQIVANNLMLRTDGKNLFREMDRKLRSNEHLTAEEQKSLKNNFARYRKNREDMEHFIADYNMYGDENISTVFPSNRPSQLLLKNIDQLSGSNEGLYINPDDQLGQLMVLEIKMWLAAKLITFDNYVVVLVRYRNKSDAHRQFDLDDIDPKASVFLEDVYDELSDDEKFERMLRMVKLVQSFIEYEKENPKSRLANKNENKFLNALINGSYSYHRIPQLTLMDEIDVISEHLFDYLWDNFFDISNAASYFVSKLFGNFIGLYEERKGKLYNMSEATQDRITAELELLDILLEKTPFRLTDMLIPGHWGHVAIWVGDENSIPELKRLGVWDELPQLEARARAKHGYEGPSFQDAIETGHGVLEALRDGVQVNTFSHFLNIDDLAVLRSIGLTDAQKKHYLLNAFKQIGKEYDFNFDAETHKRIVCSELAFVVFDDFQWPVEKSVGRYTVSPDHVAYLAKGKGSVLSPVLIIHDGEKLPMEHNLTNLIFLLREDYESVIR